MTHLICIPRPYYYYYFIDGNSLPQPPKLAVQTQGVAIIASRVAGCVWTIRQISPSVSFPSQLSFSGVLTLWLTHHISEGQKEQRR
jgi:hypothetical protein